jgi:hypothetical protein
MPDDHDQRPGFTLERGPDPWHKLPSLAARLGVQPCSGPTAGRVIIRNREGASYDVFELLNALLDRLDRAAQDAEAR